MAIKEILVHIDQSENSAGRLEVAMMLARDHGAHITGLHALAHYRVPPYAEAYVSVKAIESQIAQTEEEAKKAEAFFMSATRETDDPTWYRDSENVTDALVAHGRYSDIVILSQRGSDHDIVDISYQMPDGVVLTVGRPVLVVPTKFTRNTVGRRVLIAWDGGAMSARAVHEALPILKKADQVCVVVVNPAKTADPGRKNPADDLAVLLNRHGVSAETRQEVGPKTRARDFLVDYAAEWNADLVVCGAYGHARWKELVLGGVTDHLLTRMTIPVLMSH